MMLNKEKLGVAKMNIILVQSSNIFGIGYSRESKKLTVVFKYGKSSYEYENVPEQTYDTLMSATSIGKAFNEIVKNKYKFERVNDAV